MIDNVKITGTGMCVPETRVSNYLLEGMCPAVNPEWTYNTLGIRERRIAKSYQYTSDLAASAGTMAIENAGLFVEDIDMIIVATITPDRQAPSTACITQRKIGAYNAVCFDVAAVCSGFLYGMVIASQFIASKAYKNILVIGADIFSSITDYSRRDCVFFGDGAGAAVLSATTPHGFFDFDMHSDGSGWEAFTVVGGGTEIPVTKENMIQFVNDYKYFSMDGRAVFDTATRVLPESINSLLAKNKMTVDDITMLIPHQPSIGILKKTAETLGLPFEKVKHNMEYYANTSAGTIPILLHETFPSIKRDDIVVFAAVGSGWTWGSAVIRWR
jgi:3-oxoacyl-[acyl-carrier-protein] synthase III